MPPLDRKDAGLAAEDRWHVLHRYRDQLVAAGRRRGLSNEDAEDAASEAILRAAANPELDLAACGPWLHVVARRCAIDLLRRQPSAQVLGRAAAQLVHEDPHDRTVDRIEAEWVAGLVAELPARQRFVLHRRAHGQEPSEIAAELDCTYKTVESLVSRGRGTIRQAMSRALVALAGLTCAARRWAGSPAVVGSVTMACWVLAIAATPAIGQPHSSQVPHVVASGETHHVAGTPRAVVATHVSGHSAVGRPRAARSVGTGRDHVLVPGGAVGPVHHDPLVTSRSHEDESLLETVVRCVRDAPDLSRDHIGCS